ncbi:MAG: sterol desaturase family protein [Pseudomonadales bacterium]|nr:sterol desaturase family protein [Pseudomonadales bacterium]
MATKPSFLSPDYLETLLTQIQIWFGVFALDTMRYFIAAGLVSLVLYQLLGAWSAQRRIQSRIARPQDIRREIFYSLLTTAVYATVALFTIEALDRGILHKYDDVADYGWTYTVLSLGLLLILHDCYFYWAHRLMHLPQLFAFTHRIHHLSRTPTPWAAYSFAPPEALLMALFMPMAIFLLPLHGMVIFIFLGIMIIRNAMGHSGIEFHPQSWVDGPLDSMTSVTHHDLHHQKFNGNYGLYFTWWDRWMKTELKDYKPAFRAAAGANKNQNPQQHQLS